MKREELLKNKGYWVSKIQIDLFNQLSDYMKKNGLNRTQLAKKLGVSKGYISQILNGDFNHKLSTLVELSLSMDKIPTLKFNDISQLIVDENSGMKSFSWTITVNKNARDEENLNSKTPSIPFTVPVDNDQLKKM